MAFNDIQHFLMEAESIHVLCELMPLHVHCWILCLLYIFVKTGGKLCWMSFERMKKLTCGKFLREMKTKRQSGERLNRWNLSVVLILILYLFVYNVLSTPKLVSYTVFIGWQLSLGYIFCLSPKEMFNCPLIQNVLFTLFLLSQLLTLLNCQTLHILLKLVYASIILLLG